MAQEERPESTDIRDSPTHGPGWSSHWEANSQQQLPTPVQDNQSAFYFLVISSPPSLLR